jgi:altronate hydrolase
MGHSFVRLHESDNVAIALRDLSVGDMVGDIAVTEPIAAGHKVSLSAIGLGENITKYATTIAVATKSIAPGQHVHVHNAGMPNTAGSQSISASTADRDPKRDLDRSRTFRGIKRANGRVATRNYVGILTTVNCSATAARAMADHFRGKLGDKWPGVDGVVALTHGYGCAMSPKSEGITTLRRTIAGYARHPNFAGVLVLGLGCESNELSAVLNDVGDATDITAFDIQSVGGTREAVSRGIEIIEGILDRAKGVSREELPLSHLSLGLQCGGSDAFSGISANPALGHAADLLVAASGTVILSETPEIYGAEHLLADRAVNASVCDDLHSRVAWWRDHVAANGGTLNDNPSSGNIAGGITTILEKSLGAVAKAGTSPLTCVYEYAERIDGEGLVFMDSPGFDPMSATGQVASGANLIAFTTGRGSTFGCKPVPSLKLATNTQIFERMRDDIDVNCGDIVDGSASIKEKGREILEALIKMASGEPSASERLGFGEAEFAPWVPGAIT